MWKKDATIKNRLNMLLVICLVPLTILILYLVLIMQRFSERYDEVVQNITKANAYNIDFKDDLDYLMYIIVANSERADELIDTEEPRRMIEEAREVFQGLYESADAEYGRQRLNRILKSLDILEDRVIEIESDAQISGYYDKNMERLDLDIRVLTELIQEQIQEYIYYETTNLETLRGQIRHDVDNTLRMSSLVFLLILAGAYLISRRMMQGITEPIQRLCRVTRQAASGDFTVRAEEQRDGEMAVLGDSFNQMIEKIGNLVEDIRVEQLNLRATELKLLQAQINPHFLYNTLDTIVWLAEAGRKDEVVMMVTALSDFFRTTLSKGRDYITVKEEEAHIRSYLQIQQFRYQDILEYSIDVPEELYEYQILKLTLQPLVENALYHGIKNKRGLGHIRVSGEKREDKLIFRVWDDGRGMEPERLEKVRRLIGGEEEVDRSDPSGFGLFNVAQRLRLNYGPQYGISLESEFGEWTETTVVIPAVPLC
ncbi:histidine kinase [Lachnoclostridium sp. An131]|uniref:sensor histidine kinase n=1 Tax=Lachnoclostridium sp. An131 TaxID=1965555 RepID=UPI000B3AD4CB|nr:sensor histidine kinase [Lachnoclostridium sp. An131]OUQ27285.1 histidine kinase [Lachnoclostridium sp. An131]